MISNKLRKENRKANSKYLVIPEIKRKGRGSKTKAINDEFGKALQNEKDLIDYEKIIMGDFNGSVGVNKEKDYRVGHFGGNAININGHRVIRRVKSLASKRVHKRLQKN